jgi:hypothetical protein
MVIIAVSVPNRGYGSGEPGEKECVLADSRPSGTLESRKKANYRRPTGKIFPGQA